MQVNIFTGAFSDGQGDYRTALPVNFFAVAKETGLSKGYLLPADGIVQWGTSLGVDRGGINWKGLCYKVQGNQLVTISEAGVVTSLGLIAGSGPVTMDYSFDYLIIQSTPYLYYYSPSMGVVQITDTDLGDSNSARWFAGYTVSTDGNFVVVTELNAPTTVNPLKYGSSEADPDNVVGLERIRNELYTLNRNTIELFQLVGGAGFPFQRIESAQLMRGTLGSRTYCIFDEKLAFMGGARNEAIGVYLAVPGEAKISTREIDIILSQYSETTLSQCIVEARIFNDQKLLYVHLPDRTLVYDLTASTASGQHIWTVLSSAVFGYEKYRGVNFVYCYGKWICGDPTSNVFGYLSRETSSHYGQTIGWTFSTQFLYNDAAGAIIHRLELISVTGATAFGIDPTIWTSYSLDGQKWSQERPIRAGKSGDTEKRLVWLQQASMRRQRVQRFRGTSDYHGSFARLDMTIEPLAV